jgi:hypothetical protein
MEHVKESNMPLGRSTKFDMDKNGKNIYITKYRGMIGSLLYLIASKLNIIFSVCLCARFQAVLKNPVV